MEKPLTLTLRHEFTTAELLERGRALSLAVREFAEVEDDKKADADEFKKRLEALAFAIRELSRQIESRGADLATPCVVRFHEPKTGRKQTIRIDTAEIVREEPMTPAESQENLFEEKAEATGA